MKYGKKRSAWAVTLDFDRKHEILLGHIYETKKDAVDAYRNVDLYKPQYKITKIMIYEN